MAITRYFLLACAGTTLVMFVVKTDNFWLMLAGMLVIFLGAYLDGMAAQRRHDKGDWRA